jgi:hypothetical protein
LSKLEKVAEMELRGKTAVIFFDNQEEQQLKERIFCFKEDLEALLHRQFDYVKFYRSQEEEQK